MDTYEKKYNDALNWMRELYPGLHGATKEDAEHYFPELRESEDERIRKTLLEYFGPQAQLDFIRGVPIQKIRDWIEKQKEQKPASISCGHENDTELSEEDERRIDAICELLENTSAIHPNYSRRKLIIWLKSLRPCPSWKPSEEQMEALKEAMETYKSFEEYDAMKSLYNDLKKLGVKEEPEYYQHFDPDC